jgi:hypothetical protein
MQFATLCLVILLPIIPAFILFKALPASGDVSGKLQGLQIKLSGAFAGYFAVVVLILANHKVLIPSPVQVWVVTGDVVDENGRAMNPLDIANISISPPSLASEQTPGTFTVTSYSCPDSNGGYVYPTLHVNPDPDQYLPVADISLDPAKKAPAGVVSTVDNVGKQIKLHVQLAKLGAYNNNLAPPSPAPARVPATSTGGPQ